MTTLGDVEHVLARARRLRDGIRAQRGAGASWTFTFPDGITERYTIWGQQPVENLEDDVANLFVWAWHTKDYLKELARARGLDPQRIENLVTRTPALCLLADVANRLKHAELRSKPRSGTVPHLGRPGYAIDGSAITSLEFSAHAVAIKPRSPDAVQVTYPVLDDTGRVLADAIVLLAFAIAYWERALEELRR